MEDSAKVACLDRNLSQRLYHALTTGTEDLYRVIEDPSMDVLAAALKNRAIDGTHLGRLLKRHDLSEDLLKAAYRLEIVAESHELNVALARNPGTPAAVLTMLLPHLYLFELMNVCYLTGVTPDQKLAAERAIIQRLPSISLGNKLTLARRGTAALVETLLKEGDPRLLEACLDNAHLKEAAVFSFLNGGNASAETISMVARHPRWKSRANLRGAILKNPRTPGIWYTLFLPQLNPVDVKALLGSSRLTSPQKKLVEDELKRRGAGR